MQSISPSSVSPVLKTDLVITLDPAYPETLQRTDFRVNITQGTTFNKELRVKSVDDANKKLTVAFGGAASNTYNLVV